MARAESYPFAEVGDDSGQRYPDWLRGLDDRNGVYAIREREPHILHFIGESHSGRLYGTLTRHLQRWTDKDDTRGATYDRCDVEVGSVLVSKSSAQYLQKNLICIVDPPDNRLVCGDIYKGDASPDGEDGQDGEESDDAEAVDEPLRGYDFDVDAIIDGLFGSTDADESDDEIPF